MRPNRGMTECSVLRGGWHLLQLRAPPRHFVESAGYPHWSVGGPAAWPGLAPEDRTERMSGVGNALWKMLSEVKCQVPVHSAALDTSSFTVDDFCFISLWPIPVFTPSWLCQKRVTSKILFFSGQMPIQRKV